MKIFNLTLILLFTVYTDVVDAKIIVGAEQAHLYLPLIKHKNVGVVVNNTSLAGSQHLVDFLISKDISIKKIFAPEHGFRGDTSAGEKIEDAIDEKTGIPIISLYGNNNKPTKEHLKNIDIIVFDIQDVGCRFYTYISTLDLVIEACGENNIPLIILDRPNPNGDYVAGPVLDTVFKSFVGMDPVPIVHGCTIGEYAKMVIGEKWHSSEDKCHLTVIKIKNYTHSMLYSLPIKPSPNLPNDLSIRLYPSLCLFEATDISVGRGTKYPFQVIGSPNNNLGEFTFTPISIPKVSKKPLHINKKCYGVDLRKLNSAPTFTLKYFIALYKKYNKKDDFLTRKNWLNKLIGNNLLIEQLKEGKSEEEIVDSWQKNISKYKEIRKKYLLYTDFE